MHEFKIFKQRINKNEKRMESLNLLNTKEKKKHRKNNHKISQRNKYNHSCKTQILFRLAYIEKTHQRTKKNMSFKNHKRQYHDVAIKVKKISNSVILKYEDFIKICK